MLLERLMAGFREALPPDAGISCMVDSRMVDSRMVDSRMVDSWKSDVCRAGPLGRGPMMTSSHFAPIPVHQWSRPAGRG